MILTNIWGPAVRYRSQKRPVLWLQWPKPLNFRLIGLRGHKLRSVAHVWFMGCSLHCWTGVRQTWGKENGPRSRGIGYCEWQDLENQHRYTAFVAEPSKQHRDSTIIVLPRSRFTETWWQEYASSHGCSTIRNWTSHAYNAGFSPPSMRGYQSKASLVVYRHQCQALGMSMDNCQWSAPNRGEK